MTSNQDQVFVQRLSILLQGRLPVEFQDNLALHKEFIRDFQQRQDRATAEVLKLKQELAEYKFRCNEIL